MQTVPAEVNVYVQSTGSVGYNFKSAQSKQSFFKDYWNVFRKKIPFLSLYFKISHLI